MGGRFGAGGLGLVAGALLLSTACADGKVKSDLLSFRAHSAVWFEFDLETSIGTQHWHSFVLSDARNLCKDTDDLHQELGAAWDTRNKVFTDSPSDDDAQCAAERAFYGTAVEATDKYYARVPNTLAISLYDPEDISGAEPPAGEYDGGFLSEGRLYFLGSLSEYTGNPYQLYLDAVDCGSLNWQGDALDQLHLISDVWGVRSGTTTAERTSDDAYSLDISAEMIDESDDPAGSLEAHGTFEHCEVSWSGDFPSF